MDSDSLKSIYIMPTAYEIKVDSNYKTTKDRLRKDINRSLSLVKRTFQDELSMRGYEVVLSPKEFIMLNKKDPNENCLREAVYNFVRPPDSTPFFSVTTIPNGQGQTLNVNVDNFSSQRYEPLVTRTLSCKTSFTPYTDSVLYTVLRSNIARRKIFGRLNEKSTLVIGVKIIDLKGKGLIYSYERYFDKSDILSARKLTESIKIFANDFPVRVGE